MRFARPMFFSDEPSEGLEQPGVVRFWWLESAVLRHVGKDSGGKPAFEGVNAARVGGRCRRPP